MQNENIQVIHQIRAVFLEKHLSEGGGKTAVAPASFSWIGKVTFWPHLDIRGSSWFWTPEFWIKSRVSPIEDPDEWWQAPMWESASLALFWKSEWPTLCVLKSRTAPGVPRSHSSSPWLFPKEMDNSRESLLAAHLSPVYHGPALPSTMGLVARDSLSSRTYS